MAVWMAIGYILQGLLYLFAWQRLHLRGIIRWANITRGALREFVGLFVRRCLPRNLAASSSPGWTYRLWRRSTFTPAAYYAIAATVSTMLSVPQVAVVNTLMPIAAGISATADPEQLGEIADPSERGIPALFCA